MAIDFKRIDSPEDFELLCRDVLESTGARIVSEPARGPDQEKDLLVDVSSEDQLGNREVTRYLVQCKHNAHSGESVRKDKLGDPRSACGRHGASGYFLITSTVPSTGAALILEEMNKEEKYKTCCWDHKRLATKIEQLDDALGIIDRYGLKEPLDNLFSFLQRVLAAETELPYSLEKTIEEKSLRGLIFKDKEDVDEDPNRIGFFCTDSTVSSDFVESIKDRFRLAELYLVTSEDEGSGATLSPEDFYNHIQAYKDRWYQRTLIQIAIGAEIHPTLIRLVHLGIRGLPYPPQPETVDFLRDLITTEEHMTVILHSEACEAAAQLQLTELAAPIVTLLNKIPSLRARCLAESDKDALLFTVFTERVVSSLAILDKQKGRFRGPMKELFFSTSDLQFKANLIHYFTALRSIDLDDELRRLRERHGEEKLLAPHNMIQYSPNRVRMIPNSAPWTFGRYVDDHFKIMGRSS